MPPIQRHPRSQAWLWGVSDAGDAMLTRREAALVGVLWASPPEGVTVADMKRAVDAASDDAARIADASERRKRAVAEAAGHAVDKVFPEPFLVVTSPLPAFHAVVASLRAKNLITAGDAVASSGLGRPAQTYVLTSLGRIAASLVEAMAHTAVDVSIDPEGRPWRMLHEVIEAVLNERAVEAVVTSDRDGFRVEVPREGRREVVLRGSPDEHVAFLRGLREARGAQAVGVGSVGTWSLPFARRGMAEPAYEVRCEDHVDAVGTRTELSFRTDP